MEGIRPDEEPVLKTGGGASRLGVRVPRLPLKNTRPLKIDRKREPATQSCGLVVKAAPLQGDDRGFESLQDYFDHAQIRQSAERLGSNPGACRFDPCSGY